MFGNVLNTSNFTEFLQDKKEKRILMRNKSLPKIMQMLKKLKEKDKSIKTIPNKEWKQRKIINSVSVDDGFELSKNLSDTSFLDSSNGMF